MAWREVFATEGVLHPVSAGFTQRRKQVVEVGVGGLTKSADHGGLTATEDPRSQVKLEPVVPSGPAHINEPLATIANETNQLAAMLPLLKVVPERVGGAFLASKLERRYGKPASDLIDFWLRHRCHW